MATRRVGTPQSQIYERQVPSRLTKLRLAFTTDSCAGKDGRHLPTDIGTEYKVTSLVKDWKNTRPEPDGGRYGRSARGAL